MLIKDGFHILRNDLVSKPESVESRQATAKEFTLFRKFFMSVYVDKDDKEEVQNYEKLKASLNSSTAVSLLTKNVYTLENGAKVLSFEFAPESEVPAAILAADDGTFLDCGEVSKGVVAMHTYGASLNGGKGDRIIADYYQNVPEAIKAFKAYLKAEGITVPAAEFAKHIAEYALLDGILVELNIHDHVL
jgi:hypothetical protein